MSDKNLKIIISSEDKASPAMEKVKGSIGGLNANLVNLAAKLSIAKIALDAAGAVLGFVSNHIGEFVHEALEGEKATNQLTGAMIQAGIYTGALSKELEHHVDSLEKTVGANDEVVKSMIATGLQMGLNIEKSKEMEQAARQLAVANNIDVNQAFTALRGSMAGGSRSLAQFLPQVKDLTAAQLKQGAAIDVVIRATKAQYEIYQTSLPAAIDRAETSWGNLYKAFGQIITENPAMQAVLNLIITKIQVMADWVTENKGAIIDFVNTAILFMIDKIGFLIPIIDLLGRSFRASFVIAETAVRALITGIKVLVGGPMMLLFRALSKLPGEMGASYARAADGIAQSISDSANSTLKSVSEVKGKVIGALSEQTAESKFLEKTLLETNDAIVMASGSQKQFADAAEKSKIQASELAAALAKMTQAYAGINIGTTQARKDLEAEVSTREASLKEFQNYLTNRNRLAVSYQLEQQNELNKLRANTLKGSGGGVEGKAAADAAISAEKVKQAELANQRQIGVLNQEQYNQAMLASQTRLQEASYQSANAYAQAKADVLGESELGFEQKLALSEQHFQLELANKILQAQQLGATQEEINLMLQEQQAMHDQAMLDLKTQHTDAIAQREEISGATITATREAYFAKQRQAQNQSIKDFASGVTLMESIQAGMNASFSKLGDSLVKNEKITASKVTGIFLEMLGKQVQQKGFADLVMGIFPPNPAQIAVGAAEVALGTGIARAGVGMQGGQADSGMDSVPQSLGGKSFILSAGERVVQPSANKDLTNFLNGNKNNSGNDKPTVVNITINGKVDKQQADESVDIMIQALRRASDRGVPIISSRGIVKDS